MSSTTLLRSFCLLIALFTLFIGCAQEPDDAAILRGSLRPERTAYDVTHYALDLELFPEDKRLSGTVTMTYTGVFRQEILQIDLDEQLTIESIKQGSRKLEYEQVGNAIFVTLATPTVPGRSDALTITYAGKPQEAIRAPWDGGITWTEDAEGRPWISVSCEGIGASIWWPNKDHLSDEPDSVRFAMTVPKELDVISNGQFRGKQNKGDRTRYEYAVTYPINNYNVTFYAGHYATFTDTYKSTAHSEPLQLTYSVLDYNLPKAKEHFQQVKPMLRCFEEYLGPYPFWKDGYRLIEAPYLGMEHQSGIAYGNGYMRGYRGRMIPEDMNWDYIIIHETGHEYFGNALSVDDHGEMWVHESFTTYLEALYVECTLGAQQYENYIAYQRNLVDNGTPILGPTGINYTAFPNSDHYFKGAQVLHTFRRAVGDEAFLAFLKEFYQKYAIGQVSTVDWTMSVTDKFGSRYAAFWTQYLTQGEIPNLVVRNDAQNNQSVVYFENVIPGFEMPVRVNGNQIWIGTEPQNIEVSIKKWQDFPTNDYLFDYDIEDLKGKRD